MAISEFEKVSFIQKKRLLGIFLTLLHLCIQKYGFHQIKNNMCSKISMNFIEPGTVIDLQFELPGGVGGV